MNLGRSSGVIIVKTMAMPRGCSMPPPRPCSTRKKIRLSRFHAKPQSVEPIVKRASVMMYSRFIPTRSPR